MRMFSNWTDPSGCQRRSPACKSARTMTVTKKAEAAEGMKKPAL
jgi:hypothetical protein